MNYETALEYLSKGRNKESRPAGVKATRIEKRQDGIAIKYHDTDVVVFYKNRTVYNSGGFRTPTTKSRITEFSDIRLWQDKSVWYLSNQKETVIFEDGVTVYNDGRIEGGSSVEEAKQKHKLVKNINAYAKRYAQAFMKGEVNTPSGGDCWSCCMVKEDGKEAMGASHLLGHIDENYYVPSILNNAIKHTDSRYMSGLTKHVIADKWINNNNPKSDSHALFASKDIVNTIKRYMKFRLGLAS